MKRREFIIMLGGASAGGPLTALGQQSAVPVVGFVNAAASGTSKHLVSAFRQGLAEAGYVEGQNVSIEYRWAEGRYGGLPELVRDLTDRRVAVIAAGGPAAVLAAKKGTSSVPIVFTTGADPVRLGVVASINRPGGNVTGVYMLTAGLEGKRFGILKELVQPTATIVVLFNPKNPTFQSQLKAVNEAARAVGRSVRIVEVTGEVNLAAAYTAIAQFKPGALLVASDPTLNSQRNELVALSARHAIPTMYQWREFAEAGGLMSYGTNIADGYHQTGIYVARILRGADPAELPVMQSTKFEFVLNLKTAKALGLALSPTLLALADEVIE